jgi:alcohol dehydrogenase (cytochrome c)
MNRRKTLTSTIAVVLISPVLTMAGSAIAAEVTPERLLNPDKEPQNWLMNHRTYDGQRFSPLVPSGTW